MKGQEYFGNGFDFVTDLAQRSDKVGTAWLGAELDFNSLIHFLRSSEELLIPNADEESIYGGWFDYHLAKGTLFSVFGLFESSLIELCRVMGETLDLPDLQIDGQNSIMQQSTAYLTKIPALSDIHKSSSWNTIDAWRVIRNCFIHNSGRIRHDGDRRRAENLGLSVEANEIMITPSNISDLVVKVHGFVRYLYRTADEMLVASEGKNRSSL